MDTILDTPNNPDLPNLAAVSPWATVQKFATMQVLAAILVNLIMVTGGFLGNQGIGFLAAVPAIALLAFSLREHKEQYLNGYLPFKRVVRISWLTGLVVAIPMAIWTFVMFKYIAPGALDGILENVRTQMEAQFEKQGNTDTEMIETIVGFYKKWVFTPISMGLMTLIMQPLSMLFWGVIVGLFVRKEIPKMT